MIGFKNRLDDALKRHKSSVSPGCQTSSPRLEHVSVLNEGSLEKCSLKTLKITTLYPSKSTERSGSISAPNHK